MVEERPITTHLAYYFKLSFEQCPSPKEEEEMSQALYASAVGSPIYAMICTRPDLAYAVNTPSQFI